MKNYSFSSLFLAVSAGFVKTLLSLGFWVPLSNISFACYLTHPVFILLYIGLQETPMHYTDINFVSISDSTFNWVSSNLMLRYFLCSSLSFLTKVLYVFSPLLDVPVPWPLGAHSGGELCVFCASWEALRPPEMEQHIETNQWHKGVIQLSSFILFPVFLRLLRYMPCVFLFTSTFVDNKPVCFWFKKKNLQYVFIVIA